MAGEFLQLLASLERQKKAEVDADMRLTLATDLQRRRDDASAHRADLARKQQANMYILSHELSNKKANELEIKQKEDALEALGVVVNEYSALKSDDKTPEAQNILELTYDKDVRELDYNKLVDQNVTEKIQSVININSDYQDRNEVLDEKLRTYEAVDESLKEMSKQFFGTEMAQGLTGDWVVDEQEMAAFMALNERDFNATVAKFGGDAAEVERRLRSHFSQYSKEQMSLLNKVYTIQNQKLNVMENSIELGLLPAPAAMTAKAMQKQLDANVETFNTVITSISPNFSKEEMKNDPILRHLNGEDYTAQMGISGTQTWDARSDQRMAGLLGKLDDYDVMVQDIPAELRNDYEALALWYSGQIVRLDDFKEKHKEKGYDSDRGDFRDKAGNEYMYVDNADTEEEYSKERIGKLDWKNADFSNPENVLYGAQQFFREYAQGKQMYRDITKNKNVLLDTIGIKYDPVTGGYSKRMATDKRGNEVADNKLDQEDLDKNAAIIQFSKEFNIKDMGAVHTKARNAGMDIIDWMNQYRERATRPSYNMSKEDAYKAYHEEWDKGDGQPASVVGAEIINLLDDIRKKKKIASREWLEADGDDQLQRTRRGIFNQTGYLGQEFEELHEEGADRVDDLKEIREIARKVGDVGLWDYWLETQIGEDVVIGTEIEQEWFGRHFLRKNLISQVTQLEHLFRPLEEKDIILEATEGKGLSDQFRHRSQYDKISRFK
jgi:hypothetical protein